MRAVATSLLMTLLSSATIEDHQMNTHPYVGMWVTADRHIRHELLANGRYVEARGKRERAYLGRCVVTGNHIDYWDDTGFTATATSSTACCTTRA